MKAILSAAPWFPATLALATTACAQLSPGDALKAFQHEPDVRVELVAAEPLVMSPCAMAFDERGRLFVAENRGYPNMANPPQGDIALLEDTDGDGRIDKRTVFADGLTFPNGVMPWRGGLIVTCAPDVLFFKDTDGDGKADERKVLLTGFATSGSTQLRVNCPTLGPDGWIYFAAGLSGGDITSPEHPDRPALKMTADVRWNPQTGDIENTDGRSQYGMSFDDFGRRFICMNRLPVQHVVLSSKMLARNPHLAFSETVQDCNERSVKTGLRGGGDGVRLFPISSNITTADSHAGSFSAACGIHILQGESLGIKYRDCAFSCDPTGNLVHVDELKLEHATFSAKPLLDRREFLASRDDWFRPVFLVPGPDGALYVADMYRKVIEHPDYLPEEVRKQTDFESGKAMGRIWRVASEEAEDIPIIRTLDRATVPELVKAMDAQTDWSQQTASRLLFERRDPATVDELNRALRKTSSSHAQYRRVRMLDVLGAIDDARLAELMQAVDVGIERAAVELAAGHVPAGSAARRVLVSRRFSVEDVWFLHLIALGGIDDWRAYAEFANWSKDYGADRWVRAVVLSGIGDRNEEFLTALFHQSEFPVAARLLADLRGLDETPIARAIFKRAAEGMNDPDVSKGDRLSIIRLLGRSTSKIASERLISEWEKATEDATRSAVAASLVALDGDRASKVILAPGAWAHYSPTVRETVLNALLARRAQLQPLLAALEAGELPVSALNPAQRRIFTDHKDPAIRERAEKLFGKAIAGDRTKAFDEAKAALALTAHAEHGREVFKTFCATCHRLDREGYNVGPDLLDMRNQPKESILFHIVVPEAEVAPAFAPYLVETKDGRTLGGILASETATSLTLRMPLGVEETILRTNVAKLEAAPGSLMPAGLEAAMSRQDLADLLGFLKGER